MRVPEFDVKGNDWLAECVKEKDPDSGIWFFKWLVDSGPDAGFRVVVDGRGIWFDTYSDYHKFEVLSEIVEKKAREVYEVFKKEAGE